MPPTYAHRDDRNHHFIAPIVPSTHPGWSAVLAAARSKQQ